MLALRYPLRHSYGAIQRISTQNWEAMMEIARYAATGNFRYLNNALNLLNDSERRLWEAARIYRQVPIKQVPLETVFGKDIIDQIMDIWPVKSLEDVFIQTAVWSLGILPRSLKFINNPYFKHYWPVYLELWWRETQAAIRARFPQFFATIATRVRELLRLLR